MIPVTVAPKICGLKTVITKIGHSFYPLFPSM